MYKVILQKLKIDLIAKKWISDKNAIFVSVQNYILLIIFSIQHLFNLKIFVNMF